MKTENLRKADFYVAVNGNDDWSGTLAEPHVSGTDGPFATLSRARDAVREKKAPGDTLVLIRDGVYQLTETVVFGLEDSAQKGHTTTYEAFPSEEPIFSAGIPVGAWRELGRERPAQLSDMAKANVWVADLPEGLGRFRTLYDGQQRLPRARSEGFAPTAETIPWDRSKNIWQGGESDPLYRLNFPIGTVKNWANLEDVEILIRPSWPFTANILGLASVDEQTQTARTTAPGTFPLRKLGEGRGDRLRSLWVENVLEALTSPGEWVVDTLQRKIYLWPYGDAPGDSIVAPTLCELLRVEGRVDVDGPSDEPVRGLIFRGLTFTHGDRGVLLEGDAGIQHDWEMVDKADALVRFRGAEECVIENCEFSNSGGSAVRMDLHCQRIRTSSNLVHHLGGGGILCIGYGPGTKDVNRQNLVENNHIHHCGQIWWHAHGIVLWQSGDNRVANNTIHHMPRKAVCVSGVRTWFFNPDRPVTRECTRSIRWAEIGDPPIFDYKPQGFDGDYGYQPGGEWDAVMPYLHARNNVVEYNEVHRVGQILGDGAAINVSGAGEGNIIRRNYIHDIYNEYLAVAIRTDDIQRGTLVEENVVFRCSMSGIRPKHQNDFVGNIIVDVPPGRYIALGGRWPLDGTRIVGNIFFHPGDSQDFYASARKARSGDYRTALANCEVDGNLYCNVVFPDGGKIIEEFRKAGLENKGKYADPGFVDWEMGDFRLKSGSVALEMGIPSIDVRKAGIRKKGDK